MCSPPLGFRWPTTISIDDFFASIRLLSRPYKTFLQTLEALKQALEKWFNTVHNHPAAFAIPACSYSSISSAFPAILNDIPLPLLTTEDSLLSWICAMA
jgi:hypothetical protein